MALSQSAGNSTNAAFKVCALKLWIILNTANTSFQDKEKPMAVRAANILAARAVADAVRTSLGPRGSECKSRSWWGSEELHRTPKI